MIRGNSVVFDVCTLTDRDIHMKLTARLIIAGHIKV